MPSALSAACTAAMSIGHQYSVAHALYWLTPEMPALYEEDAYANCHLLAMLFAGSAAVPRRSGARARAAGPASAPQQPTFKVQVDYVEVDALVTDRAGAAVSDLKKEDFQVFEDGKPQTITTFSLVNIPIERLQRPLGAALPDRARRQDERASVRRPHLRHGARRHAHALRAHRARQARRQAVHRQESRRERPDGGAAHRRRDGCEPGIHQQQAAARRRGRSHDGAQARFGDGRRRRRSTPPAAAGRPGGRLRPTPSGRSTRDRRSTRCGRSPSGSAASTAAARRSSSSARGSTTTSPTSFNNQGASTVMDATRDAIVAATRSQRQHLRHRSARPDGPRRRGHRRSPRTPTIRRSASAGASLQNELRLSQDSLRTLSDETGGFAVVNRNEFATAFDRIVQDNSSYYVLAYYPPIDGQARQQVPQDRGARHASGPDASARGRATRRRRRSRPRRRERREQRRRPKCSEALDSPLPISGLTMHVFAAPFKGTAPNASVLLGIEMRGRDLKMDANSPVEPVVRGGRREGQDPGGGTQPRAVERRQPESKRARIEQTGLRLLNRLDLPPGRYQLRVAASEVGRRRDRARCSTTSNVPDFYKAPFSMSGLTLTSPAASRLPTVRPDEQLHSDAAGVAGGAADVPAERRDRALRRGVRQRRVARRTRSTSRPPSPPTTAKVRSSRPARNARRPTFRGRAAATATRRACRCRTSRRASTC